MSAQRQRDFLVELGTEELPPLALPELERAFAAGIRAGLAEAALPHGELRSFATPRRLAVLVRDLAAMQPAQAIKLKGPPVSAAFDKDGKPTAAATKFAEKCGVDVAALTRVTEGKGEFLYFAGSKPGLATASLLPAIVQRSLDAAADPEAHALGFVERGVRAAGALAGDAVRRARSIPARILDTDAGRRHARPPLHGAAGPSRSAQPADYEATLREQGKVIADFAARRALHPRAGRRGRRDAVGGEALLERCAAR